MIKLSTGQLIAHSQSEVLNSCTTKIPLSFEFPKDYNNYLLCCLRQIFHDNLFFYQIPKKFKVYGPYDVLTSRPMSFYFNVADMNPAQKKFEYTFTHDGEVLALNMPSNMMVLISTLIKTRQEKLMLSFEKGDLPSIMNYVCSLSLDSKDMLMGVISGDQQQISMIHICNPVNYMLVKATNL